MINIKMRDSIINSNYLNIILKYISGNRQQDRPPKYERRDDDR